MFTPGAKRKNVRILNFLWQNILNQKLSMSKYFGSKIFIPGAKRKDLRILNFLWKKNFESKTFYGKILWIKNFHT